MSSIPDLIMSANNSVDHKLQSDTGHQPPSPQINDAMLVHTPRESRKEEVDAILSFLI